MEYLLVLFYDEIREVCVDDVTQGKTTVLLQLEAGEHTITLAPPYDFSPIKQTVRLTGTSPLDPCCIEFKRRPPSAIPPSPGSPA